MKFGIFYELQLPRPWQPGGELALYQNALDQVELADRVLGRQLGMLPQHHHRFGRVGQETGKGYYVDAYMQLTGVFPDSGFTTNDAA